MTNLFKTTLLQAAWAPALVFVFYTVAAKVFNAYNLYPWLDIPTHFCGGLAITYFFFTAIANSQAMIGSIPKVVQLTLSVGLTAISAIVWEFLEYLVAYLFLGSKFNMGVTDTLSDLLFGLVGAVFMVAFVSRHPLYKKMKRIFGGNAD
jgi:hypothetical protein